MVGGIGLTAVKAIEGGLGTLKFIGDGYLGLLGNQAAQRRNSERMDLINGLIDNADKIPSAVKQAIVNIDKGAQAEDAQGNTFTAAMLRGNYAGEITLAIAALPQTARDAASLVDKGLATAGNEAAKGRVVARALAQELQKTEPALAAKTANPEPTPVVKQLSDTTPALVKETPKITVAEEAQSAVKTVSAESSVASSVGDFSQAAIRVRVESSLAQSAQARASSGFRSDAWYEARTPTSAFDPAQGGMDWEHFLGEVNSRGRAVGGHVANSRITELGPRVSVGDAGLYKVAPIEINGVVKRNGSTFYPEWWSGSRVRYETYQAFNNKVIPDPVGNPRFWNGVSPSGVEMQGYLSPHVTAYPFQ